MNLSYFTRSEWAFIAVIAVAGAVYLATGSTAYVTGIVIGGGLLVIGAQGADDQKTE